MSLSADFIEQLETAAWLPDEDPQRQSVLAAISREGSEARQYWLDILRADERLRLDLLDHPLPADLPQKLLAIPEIPGVRAPASRRSQWRSIAALILITAALTYWVYPKVNAYFAQRKLNVQLSELATWAVQNHVTPPGSVESSDPKVIAQAFAAAHMPIQTPIFAALPGSQLLGGGTTRLHDKPVVFTRWATGNQHFTLFEFAPEQIGLATDFPGRIETPQQLWTPDKHYAVEMWSQENYRCGWLLVKESPDAPAPYHVTY